MTEIQFDSNQANSNNPSLTLLKYIVFFPSRYDDFTAALADIANLEVILFLHGQGQRGTNLDQIKDEELAKMLPSATRENEIYVVPKLPNSQNWNGDNLTRLHDMLVLKFFGAKRYHGTGLSLGGIGMYNLMEKYPQLFSTVFVICCRDDQLISAVPSDAKPIFKHVHGDADTTIPWADGKASFDRLITNGYEKPAVFQTISGGTHYIWRTVYQNDYFDWLDAEILNLDAETPLIEADDDIIVKELLSIANFDYGLRPSANSMSAIRDGDRYVGIYCDADRRPIIVTALADAPYTTTTRYLDPGADYQAQIQAQEEVPEEEWVGDTHHVFSVAKDRDGFYHFWGDMHGHRASGSSLSAAQIERYRNSHMMYWITDNPRDVSSISFLGFNTARIPDGISWSYQHPINHPDGRLFLYSRVFVHDLGTWEGTVGLGLYEYDEATKSWTTHGVKPPTVTTSNPPTYPTPVTRVAQKKVVFWTDQGQLLKTNPADSRKAYYQDLYIGANFKANGDLHFCFAINNDSPKRNSTEITHWMVRNGELNKPRKADGTELSYPVRPSGTAGHSGDPIYLNRCAGSCNVGFDKDGNVIVGFHRYDPINEDNPGIIRGTEDLRIFRNGVWEAATDMPWSGFRSGMGIGADNIIQYYRDSVTPSTGKIHRRKSYDQAGYDYELGGILFSDPDNKRKTGEDVGWLNTGTHLKLMSYKFNFVEPTPPEPPASVAAESQSMLLMM